MARRILTLLIVAVFLLQLPLTCFAWMPSSSFHCLIDYAKIPENAVYIDLLLPITAEDANYTAYNAANGTHFGISSESQIVRYDTDGYRSYTFHIQDATAEIKPSYFISFVCDAAIYNSNRSVFEKAGLSPHSTIEPYTLNATVYRGSDIDLAMADVCSLLNVSISSARGSTGVSFFLDDPSVYNDNAAEEYYNFCRKYRSAKMAYLDINGMIISISNAVAIYKDDLLNRTPATIMRLTGNELSLKISYGPPYFLIPCIIAAFIAITVVTLCIITVQNKRKKQSKNC